MAMRRSTYLKLFPPLVSSRLVRIRRSVLYSRPIDSCSSFVFDLNRSLCARPLRSFTAAGPGFLFVVVCLDRSPLSRPFSLSRLFPPETIVLLCLDCFRLSRPFSFVSTVLVSTVLVLVSVVAALIRRERRL
jgi:hypothetical protein